VGIIYRIWGPTEKKAGCISKTPPFYGHSWLIMSQWGHDFFSFFEQTAYRAKFPFAITFSFLFWQCIFPLYYWQVLVPGLRPGWLKLGALCIFAFNSSHWHSSIYTLTFPFHPCNFWFFKHLTKPLYYNLYIFTHTKF
jgi:hypothetical protein